MAIDVVLLSRLQFAFTISFHILFPAFSIGLIAFLAITEGLWLKTKNAFYLHISKFWTKIFALTFGMGVVSGIVMEFQLGTNWAGFTHSVGGILGVLFTYEVMTAFFIEAGFLGVMLFGWDRVGPKLHYAATLSVLVGTTLSAYWIMSANSWMQHPVGYQFSHGVFIPTDWKEIVFNSATFPRFIHMMLASYISAAFVIVSISAFYLLKKQHRAFSKTCFSLAWTALFVLTPLQIAVGDLTGLEVHHNQPIKTAAMEGLWDTTRGAPLVLFALPDQKNQMNHAEVSIPHLAALINTHEWNGELQGLKSVSPEMQPQVLPVFFSFRIMVLIGFAMFFLSLLAFYLRLKKRFYDTPWFLRLCVAASPLGFIALWCGWITAEMGRQPWIVYNLILTKSAASNVTIHNVMISFGLIIVVYGIIFGYFYFYYLHQFIQKGPEAFESVGEKLPFQYMPRMTQEGEKK
jgi:cytochrome d ubiquinol oxidase subunit I